MLSKPVEQLLLEVAAHFGKNTEQMARNDLEAYLLSMLTLIREELPEVSAMLRFTIEMADYDGHLKEARELLDASVGIRKQKRSKVTH